MSFTANELIQTMLMLQAVFLAFLLIRHSPLLWPLATLFVVLSVHMGWNLLSRHFPDFIDIRAGLSLLYGPLILAMVRRLAWQDRPPLPWPLIVPALSATLILLIWPAAAGVIHLCVVLVTACCLYAAMSELNTFHYVLKHTRSTFEAHSLTWLRHSLLGLILVAVLDSVRFVIPAGWTLTSAFLHTATYGMALLLVFYLTARGWHQSVHFPGLGKFDAELVAVSNSINPKAVSLTPDHALQSNDSATDMVNWQALASELQQHLALHQSFLQPELTVAELAAQLGWPAKQLSALLNQHLKQNFNDFINTERVAVACRLLRRPEHQQTKLLSIQLDAGFASKSVFNASFKRVTGVTPTEWRRALITQDVTNSAADS